MTNIPSPIPVNSTASNPSTSGYISVSSTGSSSNGIYLPNSTNSCQVCGNTICTCNQGNGNLYFYCPTCGSYPCTCNTPNIWQPQPTTNPYIYTQGASTLTIANWPKEKYAVLDLPRAELPRAVYVCGRMLSMGILGTDVECAYTGKQLVFQPGVVNVYSVNYRIYLIVEYADEVYNYRLSDNSGVVKYLGESPKLDATLVSVIKR